MKRASGKTKSAATKARPPAVNLAAEERDRAEEIAQDRAVDEIVRRGPSGAFALAGIATAIVVAIYLGFYIFIYLPRGAVQ